jgi:hypothetical protein
MRPLLLWLVGCMLPFAAAFGSLFPDSATVDGARFPKMGEHRTTYKVFFKLYDAALFAEAGATANDVLTRDCAFRIEFRYLRSIPKATILKSAHHMLRKNLNPEILESIAQPTERLHASFRSVVRGDRSSLTYTPGDGTIFAINDQPLVTIPGKEFAEHYLQIWLGERPISLELRDHLLAR